MKDRDVFCDDCPNVPEGVTAEIQEIEFLDRRKLRETGLSLSSRGKEIILQDAGLDNVNSGFGAAETLMVRVDTVIVSADERTGLVPGNEGELYILAGAITRDEIKQKVRECNGCIRTRRDKIAGRRGDCPAISQASIIPVSY